MERAKYIDISEMIDLRLSEPRLGDNAIVG